MTRSLFQIHSSISSHTILWVLGWVNDNEPHRPFYFIFLSPLSFNPTHLHPDLCTRAQPFPTFANSGTERAPQRLILHVQFKPFLFDWPIDPKTQQPVLGAELVNASGKMMLPDRLLRELLRRGHWVLVFSQFVTMLNIIEVATVTTAYYCLDLIRMRRTGLPISWAGRSVVLMARLPRRNGGSR